MNVQLGRILTTRMMDITFVRMICYWADVHHAFLLDHTKNHAISENDFISFNHQSIPFGKKWVRDFFPSLLIRQKWHTERRDLKIGDIVLIQDEKLVRGNWRLGRVNKVFEDNDGKVRKVVVGYKHLEDQPGCDYDGKRFTNVERSSNRLVVILPIDEEH